MAESMIANHVSSPHHLAHDIRPLLYVAPNEKKRCLHVVPREHVEQMQRVRVVRTIVESQSQLLGSRLEPGKSPAIPLPTRPHTLIPSNNRGHSSTSSDDQAAQHVAIVNCFSVPL